MTNRELEIIMKLRDEVSKKLVAVQGNMLRFANAVDKTGSALKTMGHEISRVGKTMTLFGAIITGPLVLAFKNADKYSSAVHVQLEKLNNLMTTFQVQIANALVPTMERLANTLGVLWNAWMKLNPATQQAIIQGSALTGVFLTIGGALTFLIGRFVSLAGTITQAISTMMRFAILNPYLAIIIGSIAIITVLMIKFKGVADVVLNGVELALLTVANGFETLKFSIAKAMALIQSGIEKIVTFLAKIPGPQQEMFKKMAAGAEEARKKLDELANEGLGNISKNSEKMGKILSGDQGSLAGGFEDVKNKVTGLWDKLKNPPPFNIKPVAERLKTLQEISHDIFEAMNRDLSDFFYNAFMEKSFKLQNFFKQLGQSILRIWTDLLAKMITRWVETMTSMQSGSGGSSGMNWLSILGKVAGIFAGASGVVQGGVGGSTVNTGGQSIAGHSFNTAWSPSAGQLRVMGYHNGGLIRAHSGLAIDEIPIIAKRHEGVLSEKGMWALGGAHNLNKLNRGENVGGGTIIEVNVNVSAADAQSFMRFKPEITAMMKEAIERSVGMRGAIAKVRG